MMGDQRETKQDAVLDSCSFESRKYCGCVSTEGTSVIRPFNKNVRKPMATGKIQSKFCGSQGSKHLLRRSFGVVLDPFSGGTKGPLGVVPKGFIFDRRNSSNSAIRRLHWSTATTNAGFRAASERCKVLAARAYLNPQSTGFENWYTT